MADFTIVDRRKNPKGKSLSNRQRFIERVKKQVKHSIDKNAGGRSIKDDGGSDVSISKDSIAEPRWRHAKEFGDWDQVLPGNDKYMPGDKIRKPQQGGGGSGHEGAEDGDGDDEFSFTLTREEYLNIVFDGLELPNLVKESEKDAVRVKLHRAGHTPTGVPSNLNVERTAIAGLSRRIALKTPKLKKIHDLEAELAETQDAARRAELEEEIRVLRIRANAVRFLDNVDMRFNNFVPRPEPVTQAVMFCVMDVSASMEEREKRIAKRFFILLYMFLQRRYKKIDVVFIRHHSQADEVDEETFFYDKATGGTVVSTAYEKSLDVIEQRYPVDKWNIYLAQASDGDNNYGDNERCAHLLTSQLLPKLQYMSYIEILRAQHQYYESDRELYNMLSSLTVKHPQLATAYVADEDDVLPVFRDLFTPKD